MENKEKLFINGVDAYLEKVEYNLADTISNSESMKVSQLLDLIECNEKCIVIRMTREITSENDKDFYLSVSSIGKFYLDESSIKNFKDINEMHDYADDKKGFLVDKVQMGSVLSQIIANITGTFGRTPIILPAIINEKLIDAKE